MSEWRGLETVIKTTIFFTFANLFNFRTLLVSSSSQFPDPPRHSVSASLYTKKNHNVRIFNKHLIFNSSVDRVLFMNMFIKIAINWHANY